MYVCVCERKRDRDKHRSKNNPAGPVVKNLPSYSGDVGSIPGLLTKIPHSMGQLSSQAKTRESPHCNEDLVQRKREKSKKQPKQTTTTTTKTKSYLLTARIGMHDFSSFLSLFFSFIFISWRLSTVQYCSGFCHILTWISHGLAHFLKGSPYLCCVLLLDLSVRIWQLRGHCDLVSWRHLVLNLDWASQTWDASGQGDPMGRELLWEENRLEGSCFWSDGNVGTKLGPWIS